jgi:hypothetical protein
VLPQWIIPVLVLSALLAFASSRPGLWGFGGALVYGLGQFRVTIYAEDGKNPRTMARAFLQLGTSLLFGVVAAEGFGPTLAGWAAGRVHPEAVWTVVGLSSNSMWPVVERLLGGRLRAIIDALLGGN